MAERAACALKSRPKPLPLALAAIFAMQSQGRPSFAGEGAMPGAAKKEAGDASGAPSQPPPPAKAGARGESQCLPLSAAGVGEVSEGADEDLPELADGETRLTAGQRKVLIRWRADDAYEKSTPGKRALGARLEAARRIADLTLTQAAEALGYAQPVQLSLMESGKRFPPVHLLTEIAKLYGTTTDYLLGLTDEPDRDPALAAQRLIAARVLVTVNRLVETNAAIAAGAIRELSHTPARVVRLAGLVQEAATALKLVRTLNPEFDDEARGAATLIRRLEAAADLAEGLRDEDLRRRRKLALAGSLDLMAPRSAADDELLAQAGLKERDDEPQG